MRLERGKYLGGHEIAAVNGVHPFMSRHDVYARIVLGVDRDISTEPAVRRGSIIEPGFLDWIESSEEISLVRDVFLQSADVPFFAGTIDAMEVDDDRAPIRLHEVTSITSWSLDRWGEDGSPDGVVNYKWVQAQHYMRIANVSTAIVWLFVVDTGEIRRYPIVRNDTAIDALWEDAQDFWVRHVVGEEPTLSAIENGEGDSRAFALLDQLYPSQKGKEKIEATAEIIAAAAAYVDERKKEEEAATRKRDAASVIKANLRDAVGAKWEGGSVSWSKNKDGVATDYAAAFAEAPISDTDRDQITRRHTTTKPGARVLRVTMKGAK